MSCLPSGLNGCLMCSEEETLWLWSWLWSFLMAINKKNWRTLRLDCIWNAEIHMFCINMSYLFVPEHGWVMGLMVSAWDTLVGMVDGGDWSDWNNYSQCSKCTRWEALRSAVLLWIWKRCIQFLKCPDSWSKSTFGILRNCWGLGSKKVSLKTLLEQCVFGSLDQM